MLRTSNITLKINANMDIDNFGSATVNKIQRNTDVYAHVPLLSTNVSGKLNPNHNLELQTVVKVSSSTMKGLMGAYCSGYVPNNLDTGDCYIVYQKRTGNIDDNKLFVCYHPYCAGSNIVPSGSTINIPDDVKTIPNCIANGDNAEFKFTGSLRNINLNAENEPNIEFFQEQPVHECFIQDGKNISNATIRFENNEKKFSSGSTSKICFKIKNQSDQTLVVVTGNIKGSNDWNKTVTALFWVGSQDINDAVNTKGAEELKQILNIAKNEMSTTSHRFLIDNMIGMDESMFNVMTNSCYYLAIDNKSDTLENKSLVWKLRPGENDGLPIDAIKLMYISKYKLLRVVNPGNHTHNLVLHATGGDHENKLYIKKAEKSTSDPKQYKSDQRFHVEMKFDNSKKYCVIQRHRNNYYLGVPTKHESDANTANLIFSDNMYALNLCNCDVAPATLVGGNLTKSILWNNCEFI